MGGGAYMVAHTRSTHMSAEELQYVSTTPPMVKMVLNSSPRSGTKRGREGGAGVLSGPMKTLSMACERGHVRGCVGVCRGGGGGVCVCVWRTHNRV